MRNVDTYELDKLKVELCTSINETYLQIHYENNLLTKIPLGTDTLITNQFDKFNGWLLEECAPITPYEGRWLYYILEPLYNDLIKNDIPTYIEKRVSIEGEEYLEIKLPNADVLTTWFIKNLGNKLQFKNMVLSKEYELKDLRLDRFKEEK